MTHSNSSDPATGEKRVLPRRDWILLPAIGIVTVCALLGGTEFVARQVFNTYPFRMQDCLILDPATGVRGIPGSTCWGKMAESQSVEYKFNRCGDRAGMECGPKPKGVYRIVMSGASLSFGMGIPQDKSIAALLPALLSHETGRRVELYNVSAFYHETAWGDSRIVAARLDRIMAAQPDLILLIVTCWDVQGAADGVPNRPYWESPQYTKWAKLRAIMANDSRANLFEDLLRKSRAILALRHFLYTSQTQYVKSALTRDDANAYLEARLNAQWLERLQLFDSYAGAVEARARNAGVPFAVALVPDHLQSALVSMGEWPAGYDPFELGKHLRTITTSHGGIFIDIPPDFRNIPDAGQYYFPEDGHPTVGGNAIIARLLAKELTSGAVPELMPQHGRTPH